ncbi:MAG TPA: sigma-E factor negative regulatory protein [Polaromonas sp.]|uniref:sigma-E factor negative regulatory protein n=1 Tax=Polaromonas sp. TaxID=1869339 RepID=UPI002D401C90|nr:sigma-E factor negative regulatory protein [Polaromonas sp.]HYW55993.1 sigma-E factor negative regulatory protein [Polaromonas sp.]
MNAKSENRELISALVDGQLSGEDLAHVLSVCESDGESVASWNAYHLIGDVLRSPGLAPLGADAAFVTRLRGRLGQVPSLDGQTDGRVTIVPAEMPVRLPAPEAANDAVFRWKLVAGFASVAAVAAIAWTAATGLLAPSSGPELAQSGAPQQVLVMSEQGAIVRDARMQELLAAHKQFGGTSALQMPSGFLRNATFEAPQGDRR